MSTDNSNQNPRNVKLTPTQRLLLSLLADGKEIYRKGARGFVIRGSMNAPISVNKTTLRRLNHLNLIDGYHITDQGRAALAPSPAPAANAVSGKPRCAPGAHKFAEIEDGAFGIDGLTIPYLKCEICGEVKHYDFDIEDGASTHAEYMKARMDYKMSTTSAPESPAPTAPSAETYPDHYDPAAMIRAIDEVKPVVDDPEVAHQLEGMQLMAMLDASITAPVPPAPKVESLTEVERDMLDIISTSPMRAYGRSQRRERSRDERNPRSPEYDAASIEYR